jgi:tRNA(Ile)-lysidine synthase
MRKISDLSYFWAMRERFLEFIKKHALISSEDRVLLAVSGGVDSMVLLHLFARSGIPCGVAHCNFCLRGTESDADEALVRRVAESLEVPVFVKSFDTRAYASEQGVSIQMAARDLRYRWFRELAGQEGFHQVATAHHLDDSFETAMLNLVRGTSVSGLRGIKFQNGMVIRPLLDFTRRDIESWANENQIEWREDASNQDTHYHRNFVRQRVIPLLRELNPDLLNTFRDTVSRNAEAEQYFLEKVRSVKDSGMREEAGVTYLDKAAVTGPYLLAHLLRSFGFNYTQCQEMIAAFTEHSGREFLSQSHRLTVDRDSLVIDSVTEKELAEPVITGREKAPVRIGDQFYKVHFGIGQPPRELFSEKNALLDKEKLIFPLTVRGWQEGDYFQPLGMRGKKKLSDFMIDRKIPVNLKRHVRVLESAGEIVWVVGLRIDDRFKVTPETKHIFSLIEQ